MRLQLSFLILSVTCLVFAAPSAEARGGRFAGPAAAAPSARGPEHSAEEACEIPPPPPVPEAAPLPTQDSQPTHPLPHLGGTGTSGQGLSRGAASGGLEATGSGSAGAAGRTKRGVGQAAPAGVADWSYWYEANREEFEDLRHAAFVTEANPLFALGEADSPRTTVSPNRLGDAERKLLRNAVAGALPESAAQWVYTRGAAYIALAKIASEPSDVEALYKALDPEAGETQFVRESAALALGQLRRTDARRQLAGTTLDRARDRLRAVLADSDAAVRTRSFAAVSLGLLSDQPSADPAQGRRTSELLLSSWLQEDMADETQVGLLIGLGLHRPDDVSAVVRLALQSCILRGRIGSRTTSAIVRSQAALSLGRLGTRLDAPALTQALADRRLGSAALRQAVAIGAGVLAARLPRVRLEVVRALERSFVLGKEPAGRHVNLMALGRVLAAAAATGDEDLLKDAKADKRLLLAAESGDVGLRTFGALALGVAARQVDESVESEAWQAFRGRALTALRAGFSDLRLSGHARAAFAIALGLARDSGRRNGLLAIVEDEAADPELRAYAALGLGFLGEARHDVLRVVSAALVDTRSDTLRMRAATALGLLGGGGAKEREKTLAILMKQLEETRAQKVKGQIAITLARIGDGRSVLPLVRMLKGERESHMNRAMACAALGLLGDEEKTPVLSEARRDAHYMGGTSVVFELLDVL